MTQPPGFESADSHLVCKLHKALYGLKQVLRAWFDKFKSALLNLSFGGSKANSSLFFKFSNSSSMYILVYVDDIIITGSNAKEIDHLVT